MKQLYSLQILRGFAAWIVVYHHIVQDYYHFKTTCSIEDFFVDKGRLGVDLFFVLSGFILYQKAKSTSSILSYFENRFWRVIPLYWFYTVLCLLFIFFLPGAFKGTGFTLASAIQSFLLIPHIHPVESGFHPVLTVGWTLQYEIYFYLVLGFSICLYRRFAIEICSAILLLGPLILPKSISFLHVASSGLLYEFICGFVVANFFYEKPSNMNIIKKYKGKVFVFCFVVLIFLLNLPISSGMRMAVATLGLCMALLCEDLCKQYYSKLRLFVFGGDMSYSTYLLHTLIIGITFYFTKDFHLARWIVYSILTLIICVLSYLSYNYLESYFVRLKCKFGLENSKSINS